MPSYDWDTLVPKAKEIANECEGPTELARRLGVPRSTLRDALKRYDVSLTFKQVNIDIDIGLQRKEDLNELQLTYTTEISESTPENAITTVEQLLEIGQVDMDVWFVDRFELNKWPLGAKAEYKDLHWKNGTISGWSKSNGLEVVQLFQVKVWLARRKPIARFPTIQPIVTRGIPKMPLHTDARTRYRRDLICADPHFWFDRDLRTGTLKPYHDRRALDLVAQLARYAKVDNIRVLGDLFDMPEQTDRFLKSPEVYACFQPAICEAHWHLSRLRKTAPTTIHIGNHDDRLRKAILKHLKSAYLLHQATKLDYPPVLSVEGLLELKELDIKCIKDYPDDIEWLNDGIQCRHGHLARTVGDTAKAMANEQMQTTLFGHIHRVEVATQVQYKRNKREERMAISTGCLCHVDGRVPGVKRNQTWGQSAILIDYDLDGLPYSFTIIPFNAGVALYDRTKFIARDIVPQLCKSHPEWNWKEL